MAEPQTRTADKKPEKYVGTDGKTHIRMVPVRKDIVKTEKTMCPQCKGKGCSHCDNTGYHESVDEVSLDAIKKSVTAKNLPKSVNKATNKDKIKMDLAALRKKLATEAYSMNEMVCESCGDAYGKPKTESCMYDAYDKNGKNWVTKKEYLAAQKKNEEVELDEQTMTVDIDHTGNRDPDAKKHGISLKKNAGTAYSHDATGKKKDLQKYLAKHYGSHSDAKDLHPDVYKEEVEEAVGTSAKYAGKSGMFGGKYTSKDRMMDMPLDKLNKIRTKRQAQNKAAHDKQDPKMSKMGYAKHMLDTDKADAKARKRGIDPTGKYDKYKKKNNIKDSVQIDEISADLAKKALDKRSDQFNRLSKGAERADALKNRSIAKATQRRNREMGTNDAKEREITKHINTAKKADTTAANLRHAAKTPDRKADKTYDYMKKRGMKTEQIDEAKKLSPGMQALIKHGNKKADATAKEVPGSLDRVAKRMAKLKKMRNEVLDRPGALDSYRKKADDSGNRARNSATRKILTAPKDGKRPDHSDELKTMRKRNKGQDMADRVAARQFRKSIGQPYIKKESVEVEEKKLTQKQVNRALASIKPSKKKPTLPKAPWDKKEEGYASDAQRKAVWAAKNDKKQQNESVDLSEKLSVGDGMGSWIKDFQASDAPQFAGKSDKEKRNMAIAAYLSKKRGN